MCSIGDDSDGPFKAIMLPAAKVDEFLVERAVGAVTIRFGRLEFLASFLMQSIAGEEQLGRIKPTDDRARAVREVPRRVAESDALRARDETLASDFADALDEWKALSDERNSTIHAAFGQGPDGPNSIDRRSMTARPAEQHSLIDLAERAADFTQRLGVLGATVQATLRA